MEYFISYFDYYQPEAYIPRTDTFIEKDSSVNEDIERMRLATMSSLLSRRDVVVAASVSRIYGIGNREDYEALMVPLVQGMEIGRELLTKLVDIQYTRNDIAFERGNSRARRHCGYSPRSNRGCDPCGIFRGRDRPHPAF